MVDQYGSISSSNINALTGNTQRAGQSIGQTDDDGASFKDLLADRINEVNALQQKADAAAADLATGKTDNVSEVFTAMKKAELAFQTLMQIRNKLMDAYDEIKQIRV